MDMVHGFVNDRLRGNGSMDTGVTMSKESAIDLEVTGSGLVDCYISIPTSFSLPCVVL